MTTQGYSIPTSITDDAGNAIPNLILTVTGPNSYSGTATTGVGGVVRLGPLAPGDYTFTHPATGRVVTVPVFPASSDVQSAADANATFSRVGSLARFHAAYAANPATVKIVQIGDSTTDPTTALGLTTRLQQLHTQRGEALAGMNTANIISQGNNGQTLANYLLTSGAGGTYKYADLVAAAPNLVIICYGINDVRVGGLAQATLVANLKTLVRNIQRDLPNADIVLRVPNAFLTTPDATPLVFEADGVTTASAATVQSYSALLRNAYLALEGLWPTVVVADVQAAVFGSQSLSAHPLMVNQIHPSTNATSLGSTPYNGGYVAIADFLARTIAPPNAPFLPTNESGQYRRKFLIANGGNGYCDLAAFTQNDLPAAQEPVAIGDKLYVEGFAAPFPITNITRPFGGTNTRLSITGDATNTPGLVGLVVGSHAGPATGDRQIVSVTSPSVPATSYGSFTVTVTGVQRGDYSYAAAVVAAPGSLLPASGMFLVGCYPTAQDTVTVVLYNPTGSAKSLAAENWGFWVVR